LTPATTLFSNSSSSTTSHALNTTSNIVMNPDLAPTDTTGVEDTDMWEDYTPDQNAVTVVTNKFGVLTTDDDNLAAAAPTQPETEEESETLQDKQARLKQANKDRSRAEKATTKRGKQLESQLKAHLVLAKYDKGTATLLLDAMKTKLFELKYNTKDVHKELQRLIELDPAEAWESISGTKTVTGTAVEIPTKKRERDQVNYKERDSGDEEDIEDEETPQNPTTSPPKKVQKERGKQEGKVAPIFSLTPQTQKTKTSQTSPEKNNTTQNGGGTQ
jgi:hypothetical protein